jgi:hypothetical protein
MLSVELVSRTEIHRYAMLDDTVLFQDAIEHFERPASVDHEVLRNDLKPVDNRLFRQNVPVVWDAKTDPDAVFSESVVGICGHKSLVLEGLCSHARERHAPPRADYSWPARTSTKPEGKEGSRPSLAEPPQAPADMGG